MTTYYIMVHKTGIERHSVNADSPEHAYALYLDGAATLKDDENQDVSSIDVVDSLTGKTTAMAE